MSTEQNRNNPNNNSKSCNMLKRKRKMSHNWSISIKENLLLNIYFLY
jgi:hypothetical protein